MHTRMVIAARGLKKYYKSLSPINQLCHYCYLQKTVLRQEQAARSYATSPSLSNSFQIFDEASKQWQRNVAGRKIEQSREVDYLKDEIADRLVDRLFDIKRDFTTILELGSGAGHLRKFLTKDICSKVIMTDPSKDLLFRDEEKSPISNSNNNDGLTVSVERMQLQQFGRLRPQFGEELFECIVSNLYLHWVNDLPSLFNDVYQVLKPDGVFIGAMFGGDTLYELRGSLQLADQEKTGGLSPRISPMVRSKDLTSLLQSAGFVITTGKSSKLGI